MLRHRRRTAPKPANLDSDTGSSSRPSAPALARLECSIALDRLPRLHAAATRWPGTGAKRVSMQSSRRMGTCAGAGAAMRRREELRRRGYRMHVMASRCRGTGRQRRGLIVDRMMSGWRGQRAAPRQRRRARGHSPGPDPRRRLVDAATSPGLPEEEQVSWSSGADAYARAISGDGQQLPAGYVEALVWGRITGSGPPVRAQPERGARRPSKPWPSPLPASLPTRCPPPRPSRR